MRNNIPQFIEDSGSLCTIKTVTDHTALSHLLQEKMVEEMTEFMLQPSVGEACDMIEVVRAFCEVNGLEFNEALKAADTKRDEVGGFSGGIFLERVIYNR